MKTQQLYLDDSYLKEMEAEVLDIQPEEDGKFRLILDKTVFYPMGGGQPTDQGTLIYGDTQAEVYLVMTKDGEIWHYLKTTTPPAIGTKVTGKIDWDRRYHNMRLHSGGHIVDFAVYLLGYSPKTLLPMKGEHGKKAFIVYQGVVGEDIKQAIADKVNELVEKDLKFSWLVQPLEELEKEAIYLQPGLPSNKALRTLRLENVGAVADGGTQVHSTKEIGPINIDAVEIEDGNTLVSYSLSQP